MLQRVVREYAALGGIGVPRGDYAAHDFGQPLRVEDEDVSQFGILGEVHDGPQVVEHLGGGEKVLIGFIYAAKLCHGDIVFPF